MHDRKWNGNIWLLWGWISCLQLLHAFPIPIMRLRWNHRQSFWSCLTQTASVSAAVVPSRAQRWHTQTQKHQQSAINRPLFKSQDALCRDIGTVAVNCFATVCTSNQSLYYSKRSTVCIAQQKHDRTQNNISHIGLTSMVLCHGAQKLEQNGWFRPESFRSPRNACNSSRSFVVSFNFARTVSADRYGMLIKIPPFVIHQAFHGTKIVGSHGADEGLHPSEDVAVFLILFTKVWVVGPISTISNVVLRHSN